MLSRIQAAETLQPKKLLRKPPSHVSETTYHLIAVERRSHVC